MLKVFRFLFFRTKYTFKVYEDAKKEWRWRLEASNNKIVANSGEGFISKQTCINSIGLIKKYAKKSTIEV